MGALLATGSTLEATLETDELTLLDELMGADELTCGVELSVLPAGSELDVAVVPVHAPKKLVVSTAELKLTALSSVFLCVKFCMTSPIKLFL